MPATYDSLATTTLGAPASSITFSSISAAYTDLRLVFIETMNSATDNLFVRVNGNSGPNYDRIRIYGDGTNLSGGSQGSDSQFQLSGQNLYASLPQAYFVDFFSYANTSTHKDILAISSQAMNDSNSAVVAFTGVWKQTTAINSISISTQNGNTFAAGTSASLYGILRA